MGRK
jgi:hypothetical protein